MVTLFLWGLVVDRVGERAVLLAGLAGQRSWARSRRSSRALVALCAVLFVVGMFAACTGSASGRIVVGWFPPRRRGLAMGIRQMAQPLGVAVAAATIAVTADRGACGGAGSRWSRRRWRCVVVLVIVLDPPRPTATAALTPTPTGRTAS